jgi:TonB family protein
MSIALPAFSSPQDGASAAPSGRKVVPATAMVCTKMVSPYFPPQAQAKGAQTVVLQVVVRSTGAVNPIHLVSGSPALEAEAMNAVRLWRFLPYKDNGQAIDVVTNVKVDFIPGKMGGMESRPER